MSFRDKRRILTKILLAVILLVTLPVLSGCIRGLQPIGWSGVAIAGDQLYVGSKEGRLVAINADDRPMWSEPLKAQSSGGFGCAPSPGTSGGIGCAGGASGVAIYGTPVVSGDLVYISAYNGKIYAFNANTLQLRWLYPREDYLEPIVSGVAAGQDKIYFGTSDGKVLALDAATGDKEWEVNLGDKIWATPVVSGSTLFVGSFDKKLYALDTTDGIPKWEFPTEGAIATTPLVYNDTVYISSFDRNLYAVNASDGELIWKFQGGNWFWATPVAAGNVIYAACLDGKVYALDAVSGEKTAEFDLGGSIASSPVLNDKSVIVVNESGEVYSIDTASNKMKQLAAIEAKNVSAPLAASDNTIYIHTADLNIHRIDAETGAELIVISLKRPE